MRTYDFHAHPVTEQFRKANDKTAEAVGGNSMKKFLLVFISLFVILGLVACSSNTPQKEETSEETPEQQEVQPETEKEEPKEEEPAQNDKALVVYFSATSNTEAAAEKIAKITGADLYEILAKEPYSDDDLNWHDSDSRSTKEQNDSSVRPEIGSEPLSLEGYTTIYVGYLIWWGEEPRILDTFVESYDFSGITMIPFCTSSSSGIGRSGKNLAEHAGSGNWLDGARFASNVSEETLASWIEGLQ